jgi:D-psicose/D-tagatose/L-ribulose 3-epimerase
MGAHSGGKRMSLRIVCAVLGAAALAPPVPAADRLPVRFGVAAFGAVDPLRDVKTVAGCGYDYIEPALSKAVALSPEALAAARQDVRSSGIRVETVQLADFLRLASQVIKAHGYGMVIGIEALRKPETNIVNSVAEALRLAREVNDPRVRLNVDFYHLAFENEDPDVVLQAGPLIAHLQISDPAQRGFPKDDAGEPRYRRFFDNLRKVGYRGRISVEAESKDLAGDCGPALRFLKRMAAPSRD